MNNLTLKKGTEIAPGVELLINFDLKEFERNDYTVTVKDSRHSVLSKSQNKKGFIINSLLPKTVKSLYIKNART